MARQFRSVEQFQDAIYERVLGLDVEVGLREWFLLVGQLAYSLGELLLQRLDLCGLSVKGSPPPAGSWPINPSGRSPYLTLFQSYIRSQSLWDYKQYTAENCLPLF